MRNGGRGQPLNSVVRLHCKVTRNQLRILFALPVLLTFIVIAMFELGRATWPPESTAYFRWYINQPSSQLDFLMNRLGLVGLVGLFAASIGLMLFWSPARYVYVFALVLTFAGDFSSVPGLVGGWSKVIESIAQTLIGINIDWSFRLRVLNYSGRAMQPNSKFERTGVHRGRAVLAMDCVLGGAEWERCLAAQLGR
jgi:hypothetical protein